MTQWLPPQEIVSALMLACMFLQAPVTDLKETSPRADALDLLILGEIPVRIEIRVSIDRVSIPEVWDKTFSFLLTFFDRNGDGTLDNSEAGRLPSAFALRQSLWGQIVPYSGESPPFIDLDLNSDSKVNVDELGDYYRKAGLGGVLVGVGKPPATGQLTDALLRHLDTNKDGRVEESEWKDAPASLWRLDKNEDELIGPGELIERTIYPGATGSTFYTAPSPLDKPDLIIGSMPIIVLPLRTKDTFWATSVIEKCNKSKAVSIPPHSLIALRNMAPAVEWNLNLGIPPHNTMTIYPKSGKSPANDRLTYSSGGIGLVLRADQGKLREQNELARRRFSTMFNECDSKPNGTLDENELSAPKAALMKLIALAADRDLDSNLTRKEFNAWLDLQDQIVKGHVMLSILDHDNGLFEFMDADHDGSLSVREIRSVWQNLKEAGVVTERDIDRKKLPRLLLSAVSHGHPCTAIGKPVRNGSVWFRAMDRNGDGDVSRSEFLGDPDLFNTLDLDHDGLLDPCEAEKLKK